MKPAKRILIVHNAYQEAGGEDSVVKNEAKLLADFGHEVKLATVSNDAIDGVASKVLTALRANNSSWGQDWLEKELAAFQPDIVHVHNFFPLLSPAVFDTCRKHRLPVIHTLHNYRLMCASGLLLRDGRPCEDCIEGSSYQSVLHGCYRNSRLGSLVLAHMIDWHKRARTWHKNVDQFIALSEFSKGRFVAGGFPTDRISVKPNFVPPSTTTPHRPHNFVALFVGRDSPEKGLETLIAAARDSGTSVRIVGTDKLHNSKIEVPPSVTFLGSLSSTEVRREMSRASVLVVPSKCYENFPVVIAEAFAEGLPVLCSRLGSLVQLVDDGAHGMHFSPGSVSELCSKLTLAAETPELLERMSKAVQLEYASKYTPERNYKMLLHIYEKALNANSTH